MSNIKVPISLLFLITAALPPIRCQTFEISPLVGGSFGGSFKLDQQGLPNFHADIASALNYGIAGGAVLPGDECQSCSTIEFRWVRQDTHLDFPTNLFGPSRPQPSVKLDDFLGDLTHEWPLEDSGAVRPFLTGTLGAVRLDAPQSSSFRFAFGLGAGIKVFPSHHVGFQIKAEWLAIALHGELQKLVCTGAGGCIVVLNGGITNQFLVSAGPAFRF